MHGNRHKASFATTQRPHPAGRAALWISRLLLSSAEQTGVVVNMGNLRHCAHATFARLLSRLPVVHCSRPQRFVRWFEARPGQAQTNKVDSLGVCPLLLGIL